MMPNMDHFWMLVSIASQLFLTQSTQINFYLTDSPSHTEQLLRHHCLEVPRRISQRNLPREVISYCFTEWPNSWTFYASQSQYPSLTFQQLAQQNITSEQLFFWLASIDLIEKYQHYLDRPDQYKEDKDNDIFYNCTWSRFGPSCQFTFDHLQSISSPSYPSLTVLVNDYYYTKDPYRPTTFTCYEHLQCNRGFQPSCIDWTEICDGKIDCLNGAQDEEQCWQLEMNQCADDEYRCLNGQCIHRIFHFDGSDVPECLDTSDEPSLKGSVQYFCDDGEPMMTCEDITCPFHESFAGSGISNMCGRNKQNVLTEALYSVRPSNLSDNCWFPLVCRTFLEASFTILCAEYCSYWECGTLIAQHCPQDQSHFFLPSVPVLFGHLRFLYAKNRLTSFDMIVSPDFVCLDHHFCSFLPIANTTFGLNNLTCHSAKSIQFLHHHFLPLFWSQRFLKPAFDTYFPCAALPDHYYNYCEHEHLHMYRCINTSKCISKYRLLDKFKDCFYGDDEVLNIVNQFINLSNDSAFFHCSSSNTFISHRLVGNGECDCPKSETKLCDDEYSEEKYFRTHISFQTICDGFTELIPLVIDGQRMTDETDCGTWLCDNIYTRCDMVWNCFDGRDEVDCNRSSPSSIECSSDSRSCVLPQTNELICLPVEKVNDGHVDCLGATDEPQICRSQRSIGSIQKDLFNCNRNDSSHQCLMIYELCARNQKCQFGDDQHFCRRKQDGDPIQLECTNMNLTAISPIEKHLCERFNVPEKPTIVYFSIIGKTPAIQRSETYQTNLPLTLPKAARVKPTYNNQCHRGLNLQIWHDRLSSANQTMTIACLCPPSYYGSQCQYQNQRVSITLQFRALSDAWQTTFIIVAFLIDHTPHQYIHSTQQFTYLPLRDCQVKFNLNLLFATRSMNGSLNYSVHFDIYEQHSHRHRGSYLAPIIFPFLPVYRISVQLEIPRLKNELSCSDLDCGKHGRCLHYTRVFHSRLFSPKSFCQCDEGWSGRLCTTHMICSCASGARCLGSLMNSNRSICLCPPGRFGPRCYLSNTHICRDVESEPKCLNGGRCNPLDGYQGEAYAQYTCDCPKGFTGDRCQYKQTQIIISFDSTLINNLSQFMLVHFIRTYPKSRHENTTTFKLIPFDYQPVSIFWSHPFHLVFVEFHHHHYYLALVHPVFNQSGVQLETVIRSSDRCPHIRDLLSSELLRSHRLYRIKSYHLLCRQSNNTTQDISCFYDEEHFCFCQSSPRNGNRREANCFEYDHKRKFDCFGQNACENGGQCFQDNPLCPQTSVCMCNDCSYGRRCQFTMDGFRLSLDAILGYHIQPRVPLRRQPPIVHLTFGLVIVMTITGIINGVLSALTFNNKRLCEVGCGYYLLASSVTTLTTIVFFLMKFLILLTSQMGLLTNTSFLAFQCRFVDYFLRVSLNLDQWFNALVSFERATTTLQGINFNKPKSVKRAAHAIAMSIVAALASNIYDPIYRRVVTDSMNSSDEMDRIWCVVSYPKWLQFLDSFIHMASCCIPFLINFVSVAIIVWGSARYRWKAQMMVSFRQVFIQQLHQHKHILIGPIVIMILSVPRLILAIVSGCMKSNSQSRLYLAGYLVSFAPALLSFIIFVLPSKFYRKQFQNTVGQYRNITRSPFRIARYFVRR